MSFETDLDLLHNIYDLDLGLRTQDLRSSDKIVKSCGFWEPRTQAIRRISDFRAGRIADPNLRLFVQIEISRFCKNFTFCKTFMTTVVATFLCLFKYKIMLQNACFRGSRMKNFLCRPTMVGDNFRNPNILKISPLLISKRWQVCSFISQGLQNKSPQTPLTNVDRFRGKFLVKTRLTSLVNGTVCWFCPDVTYTYIHKCMETI